VGGQEARPLARVVPADKMGDYKARNHSAYAHHNWAIAQDDDCSFPFWRNSTFSFKEGQQLSANRGQQSGLVFMWARNVPRLNFELTTIPPAWTLNSHSSLKDFLDCRAEISNSVYILQGGSTPKSRDTDNSTALGEDPTDSGCRERSRSGDPPLP